MLVGTHGRASLRLREHRYDLIHYRLFMSIYQTLVHVLTSRPYKIEGNSMLPALNDGQYVLQTRTSRPLLISQTVQNGFDGGSRPHFGYAREYQARTEGL